MNGTYLEFMKKVFRSNYTYKTNSYIHIITGLLEVLVQISVWYALIPRDGAVDGVSFGDMVNFIIINRVMNSLTRANIADTLAARIRDGSVAIDLIRPIKIKLFLIAENLGNNFYWTLFGTIPVCLVIVLFFKFNIPSDSVHVLLFFTSAALGIVLSYSLHYVLGLLVFWFKTGFHIRWIQGACNKLFAGNIVPIWFYPGMLYSISMLLPFRLISFEPISIYLGKSSIQQSVNIIMTQIVWVVVLIILEKLIWQKAQKVIMIQGG